MAFAKGFQGCCKRKYAWSLETQEVVGAVKSLAITGISSFLQTIFVAAICCPPFPGDQELSRRNHENAAGERFHFLPAGSPQLLQENLTLDPWSYEL